MHRSGAQWSCRRIMRRRGQLTQSYSPHTPLSTAVRSKANAINTVIVTLSLPSRSPHHCGRRLLTAAAIGSNLTGSKRRVTRIPPWRINMHLRMIRFPSARPPVRRGLPPACSLSMRSSPRVPSLPSNSAPSHGLPSRPSPPAEQMTAAWVGAAVSISIGKLPARDGFRRAIAGTGSKRSCTIFHFSRLDPMPHESAISLTRELDTMLPRNRFAVGCRCAVCESRRAIRLAQALQIRYGRGLAPRNGEIDEP
jgi:hypothetical protein